jgi:hypothetical protein
VRFAVLQPVLAERNCLSRVGSDVRHVAVFQPDFPKTAASRVIVQAEWPSG